MRLRECNAGRGGEDEGSGKSCVSSSVLAVVAGHHDITGTEHSTLYTTH